MVRKTSLDEAARILFCKEWTELSDDQAEQVFDYLDEEEQRRHDEMVDAMEDERDEW